MAEPPPPASTESPLSYRTPPKIPATVSQISASAKARQLGFCYFFLGAISAPFIPFLVLGDIRPPGIRPSPVRELAANVLPYVVLTLTFSAAIIYSVCAGRIGRGHRTAALVVFALALSQEVILIPGFVLALLAGMLPSIVLGILLILQTQLLFHLLRSFRSEERTFQ